MWLVDTIIDHSNPQEPVTMWFPGDDLFTAAERRGRNPNRQSNEPVFRERLPYGCIIRGLGK